jgi:hypothetical protein
VPLLELSWGTSCELDGSDLPKGFLEEIAPLPGQGGQKVECNIPHASGLLACVVIVLLACDGQLRGSLKHA